MEIYHSLNQLKIDKMGWLGVGGEYLKKKGKISKKWGRGKGKRCSQSKALLTAEGRFVSVFCRRDRTAWRPSARTSLNTSDPPGWAFSRAWHCTATTHRTATNSIYNAKHLRLSATSTTLIVLHLQLIWFHPYFSLQYILIKIEWLGGFFMPSRGRGVGNGTLVDNRTFKLVLLDIELRNEYFEGQGKVI